MTVTRQDDKPWKTDLARKAAERREQVAKELEDVIKKAPSFEEALRQGVELMKKRFARYSAVTAYVADGEELAVHIALERPQGPERVRRQRRPAGGRGAGREPDGGGRPRRQPGLGRGRALERQRDGGPGPHRGRPVGDPRGLERLPRGVLAARTRRCSAAWRRRSPRRRRRPDVPCASAASSRRSSLRSRADGALDLAAFEANLDALAAHDLAGFLVLGSNGEAASLEEEEKLALVAAVAPPPAGPFPAGRDGHGEHAGDDRPHAQGCRPAEPTPCSC